jgi:SGNH hydrolase-like domain, acetyltransferase AlgX
MALARTAGMVLARTAGEAASELLPVLFLALVAACLAVPLLQTVHPFLGAVVQAVDEHRAFEPFPSPRLLLRSSDAFAVGLNKWFDDRVGLRDLFIRTKNQIDFSVFGTSRKILVGSDGWLFNELDRGLDLERLDAAGLKAVENSFLVLARRLQDKGVRLLVVGYPDKSRIYPEMLPAEATVIPPGGNYDRLRQFLARQSSLMFIDVEAISIREKQATGEHLFAKTDPHMTEVGQLPVVQEIVARIAQAEGRPEIKWEERLELTHDWWPGGEQARFMSLLLPQQEYYPSYRGGYTIGGEESDGHWYLPDPFVLERADDGIGRPFDWEFRSLPELCNQRLPGMVLFGNSFSDFYWALGLHRYFCFIRRARDPISRFNTFFETMPANTKYFIFQYYLRLLVRAAPPLN